MKRRTLLAGIFAALAAPVVKAAGGAVVDPVIVIEDYKLPNGQGVLQFRLTQQGEKKECSVRLFSEQQDVTYRLSVDPSNEEARTIITASFWQKDVSSGALVSSVLLNSFGEITNTTGHYMTQNYHKVGALLSPLSVMTAAERKKKMPEIFHQFSDLTEGIRQQLLPGRAGQWRARLSNAFRSAPRP